MNHTLNRPSKFVDTITPAVVSALACVLVCGASGVAMAVLLHPLAALPFFGAASLITAGTLSPALMKSKSLWTFSGILLGLYFLYEFQDIIVVNLDRFGIPLSGLFKKSDEGIFLLMSGFIVYRKLLLGKPLTLHPLLLFPIFMTYWSVICQMVNEVPLKIALLDCFLMIKGYFVLFIALNVDFNNKTLRNMLMATTATLIFVAIVEAIQIPFPAVAEAIFGVEPMLRSGSVRPTGPFEHPGTLGTFLGFTANLLFGVAFVYRSKRIMLFYLMCMGCLVMSLTIRQFTGHALGIVVFLALRDPKLLIRYVLIGLALIPLAWPVIDKNIQNVKKNYVLYQGDTVRKQAYLNMHRILDEKPIFGVGPGRFGGFVSITTFSDEYGRRQFDWINQELYSLDAYWPHIFSEYGYPGGIMFLMFLAGVAGFSFHFSGRQHHPMIRAYGIACFFGVFLGLFDSTFSTFYENTFVCLIMYTQLGLLLGYAQHLKQQRTHCDVTA